MGGEPSGSLPFFLPPVLYNPDILPMKQVCYAPYKTDLIPKVVHRDFPSVEFLSYCYFPAKLMI